MKGNRVEVESCLYDEMHVWGGCDQILQKSSDVDNLNTAAGVRILR